MIFSLASKEFSQLFITPIGWVLLALFQLLLSWLFFLQLDIFMAQEAKLIELEQTVNVTDLLIIPVFNSVAILCMILTPFLTMRLISNERQEKTISLLFSSPISSFEIILGKYLAIIGFFTLIIALTLFTCSFVLLGSELDTGKIISATVALFLLISSLTAIGLYFSTLTDQPATAALLSFGLIFFLYLIGWNSLGESNLLTQLSIKTHYESMLTGLIKSEDIIFFLLISSMFLIWSIYKISSERWAGA
jgi:ABC-2 type transport system permease protein